MSARPWKKGEATESQAGKGGWEVLNVAKSEGPWQLCGTTAPAVTGGGGITHMFRVRVDQSVAHFGEDADQVIRESETTREVDDILGRDFDYIVALLQEDLRIESATTETNTSPNSPFR